LTLTLLVVILLNRGPRRIIIPTTNHRLNTREKRVASLKIGTRFHGGGKLKGINFGALTQARSQENDFRKRKGEQDEINLKKIRFRRERVGMTTPKKFGKPTEELAREKKVDAKGCPAERGGF